MRPSTRSRLRTTRSGTGANRFDIHMEPQYERLHGDPIMSTRPIHLGLDIDGVFADFNAAFRKKLIDLTGVDKFQGQPATTWHYATEQFGYDREDVRRVWQQIHDSPNFWLDINPRPGAIPFFTELR